MGHKNLCHFLKRFYLFLKRGEERKKERGGEKHQLVASGTRPHGDQTASQACAWIGNRTGNLSLCGMMPNHLSRQGENLFLTSTQVIHLEVNV